jgi:AcrR family transcriptional regulator
MAKRRRLAPEKRREEILAAAEQLLAARGLEVRVDDVVRAAGTAKGTFYLYFPTWDDLLKAVRTRIFANFEAVHPLPLEAPPGFDWMGHLLELAEAFVDAVVRMEGLHEAIFHSDFAARHPMSEEMHPVGRLARLLRAGQAAGSFGPFEPEPMARLIFAVIHETADAVAEGDDRESCLRAMRQVLGRALGHEEGPLSARQADSAKEG